MSNFRAAVTGNSSDLATWEYFDGANWVAAIALPQLGDVVYANAKTVTFDADIEASEWRNDAIAGVTAGGGFVFGAADEIVGDCYSGPANCVTNNSATVKTIVGSVFGGTSGSFGPSKAGAYNGSSGGITIVGDAHGGPIEIANGFRYQSGTNTLTGTAYGGNYILTNRPDLTANGVYGVGSGSISINAARGRIGHGVYAQNGASATVDTVERYDNGLDSNLAFGCNIAGLGVTSNIYNEVDSSTLLISLAELSATDPISVTLTVPRSGGSVQVDYLAGSAGYPAETDVKDGVVYGNSNQFEGTLEQVDAAQLASDLLDEIQTSSHVVAQRLRVAATDDSVGQIVTSTLGSS